MKDVFVSNFGSELKEIIDFFGGDQKTNKNFIVKKLSAEMKNCFKKIEKKFSMSFNMNIFIVYHLMDDFRKKKYFHDHLYQKILEDERPTTRAFLRV